MNALVPSYIYPGTIAKPSPWNTLLASKPHTVGVIINPDSGPGSEFYSEYSLVVRQCRKNDIGVFGYVATTYADKPLDEVQAEVLLYRSRYAVIDIFFDEVTSAFINVGYFKYLYGLVEGKVILNPGVIPDEAYYSVADKIVIFESEQAKHALTKFPAWLKKYRKQNCQIVHTCPGKNLVAALKKIAITSSSAFVTNAVMPNPYNVLPAYWATELKENAKLL